MKSVLALLLSFILVFVLSACGEEREEPEVIKFVVETAFEYSYENNGHFRHVIMPKVADSVPEGDIINERLMQYNTLEELKDSETWAEWPPEESFKRYYNISNKDGICSLNVLYENLREGGNPAEAGDYHTTYVESFYYDENENRVLSQEEYLQKLGITEEQILQQFNEEYGDQYRNRTYDFSHILFWYDSDNQLQFSPYQIDQMDSNTADFHLIINGERYKMGMAAPEESPFGEATNREEKYYGEVWAGSWWIEEFYDGAYVLYSWNKEAGSKTPFHVEITEADEDVRFIAYTYRDAAVGDTKDRILELYPEIDPQEQSLLYDTEYLLKLTGNDGYMYLEFHFNNDVVTKIAAGILID